MKPIFPDISTVSTQALGAAQLLSYKMGIEYLLGESHATIISEWAGKPSEDVWETAAVTIRTWYLRHTSNTLYYKLALKTDWGNEFDRDWSFVIQVFIGAAWETAVTDTGTNNTYVTKEGTTDITALGLVTDTIYQWRLRIWCSTTGEPEDYHVCCIPWSLRERAAVVGWQAPHTFAAGVSAAAHFNDWRTDLLALHAAVSPVIAASSSPPEMTVTALPTNWEVYDHWAYRYRPESLRIIVQGATMTHADPDTRYWRFRVRFEDDAYPTPNSAVIFTGDPQYGMGFDWYTFDDQTLVLTTDPIATILSGAGITLTFGNWYRIIIEVERGASDQVALIRHAYVLRTSLGTPTGGWAAMHLWVHGDNDIGPTELNKYSSDLGFLYDGAERDFREAVAVCSANKGVGMLGFTSVHRRRWLHYLAPTSPCRLFWSLEGRAVDPPIGDEWQVFDLDDVGMIYGTFYVIVGPTACFESETP